MKLISVNVGLPREVTWKNQTVTTGIFKESVSGRVKVSTLNLEGDQQADLTMHGDEIEPVSRETRQGNSVRYYESLR